MIFLFWAVRLGYRYVICSAFVSKRTQNTEHGNRKDATRRDKTNACVTPLYIILSFIAAYRLLVSFFEYHLGFEKNRKLK